MDIEDSKLLSAKMTRQGGTVHFMEWDKRVASLETKLTSVAEKIRQYVTKLDDPYSNQSSIFSSWADEIDRILGIK